MSEPAFKINYNNLYQSIFMKSQKNSQAQPDKITLRDVEHIF